MASNTSVALADVTDFVYDEGRHQLYALTSSGGLYVWGPATGAFRQWASFSNAPSSIDIAPSGAFVLVAHSTVNNAAGSQWDFTAEAMIRRFWLDTAAVEQVDLTVNGYERGFADLAITSTNVTLATTDFAGSGWTPFHTFSATTPHMSQIGSATVQGLSTVRQSSHLITSANNQYVFVLEDNISSAPIHIYDAAQGRIVASNNLYNLGAAGFNSGRADINDTARLAVNATSNTVVAYDFSLNPVKNLTPFFTNKIVAGVLFSQDGRSLFVWEASADEILVYDTTSWNLTGSLKIQADIGYPSGDTGRMILGENGRFLILNTGTGLEAIDLNSATPAPLPPLPSAGVVRSGGDGADQLAGTDANDTLSGGAETDQLNGGAGDDRLDGGPGNDFAVYFNATGPILVNLSAAGPQTIGAGAGVDTLIGIEGVFAGPYDDIIVGTAGPNQVVGHGGDDSIVGHGGNDDIQGNDGADSLFGDEGDDALQGGRGDDRLDGGSGVDTAEYLNASSGVTVSLSQTTQSVGGGEGVDTLIGIENISGSVHGDSLTGNVAANLIRGWGGADILAGQDGDDTLDGREADDTLSGGAGADRLEGGPGRDVLTGGGGNDVFWVGAGNSGLWLAMADVVTDWSAADALSFGYSTMNGNFPSGAYAERTAASYDAALATANGLISSSAATFVAVQVSSDVLVFADTAGDRGAAEDVVVLPGRTLNDISETNLVGAQAVAPPPTPPSTPPSTPTAPPPTSVVGTPQPDMLQGGGGDDERFGGEGDDTITDTGGQNYLRGEDGDDTIAGGSGFDDINGNRGNDTAAGGAGQDWVVGGKDHDLLFGGDDDDIVYGNIGQDTCMGGDGDDIVRGGQDGDSLSGGAGNDWLSGDRGDDSVAGGLGADVFHTFGEAGIDRVLDFNRAEGDRVMLTGGGSYSLSQVGADAVVTLNGGGQMILVGVSASSLTGTWLFEL